MKKTNLFFCLLLVCLISIPAFFVAAQDPTTIVNNAYQDILGRNADKEGMRFFRSKIIDEGWTEQQVRAAIRKSDEYKITQADNIITRAYEDILNRKPDPSGRKFYSDHIIKDNWTEKQVRDSLRQSQEYLNKHK